jgi:hypothetical protein
LLRRSLPPQTRPMPSPASTVFLSCSGKTMSAPFEPLSVSFLVLPTATLLPRSAK